MERAEHVAMIVRDPLWLAHRYDPGHDSVHFLKVDRDILGRTPFLIDSELPQGLTTLVLGREESMVSAPDPAPLHLILHSGYCCSTLLARAFDRPGLATTLKEPAILNDLVGWRRRGDHAARVPAASTDLLRLLARPCQVDETVIVKPSNILNAIAAPLMEANAGIRALLLHAPLPVYLGSIARKGMAGALWVREHLVGALQDGIMELGFDRDDYLGQTDLQIAAMGWLAQQSVFQALVDRFGPDRVRTIDSETLLAGRADALDAIAGLFGLTMEAAEIKAIADGPVFTRHSKFATPFNPADRIREQDEIPAARRDEIAKIVIWTEIVAQRAGIPLTLGSPLLD
jgi:hypothetical protein